MQYALPWDRTTVLWTLVTVGALVLLTVLSAFWYRSAVGRQGAGWPYILSATVCVLSIVSMAVVAPLSVRVRGPRLTIRRPVSVSTYDLSTVTTVEILPYEAVFSRGTIRTFGVGGPFGLIGQFRSPSLGAFRAAVTHRNDLVVVRFQQEPALVLSPESPHALAAELQQAGSVSQDNAQG